MAVMQNLRRAMQKHELASTNPDLVVVNGEGSMHHDHGRKWLELLGKAPRGMLLNSVFQANTAGTDVLARLEAMHTREPLSALEAEKFGARPQTFIDASVLTPWWFGKRIKELGPITHGVALFWRKVQLRNEFPLHGAKPTITFADVVQTLAQTPTVYVTGEHHGVIAAGLARSPFVPIPGNTWKIEGLLGWFETETGIKIPVARTQSEVEQGISWAKNNHGYFVAFHHWVLHQRTRLQAALKELFDE